MGDPKLLSHLSWWPSALMTSRESGNFHRGMATTAGTSGGVLSISLLSCDKVWPTGIITRLGNVCNWLMMMCRSMFCSKRGCVCCVIFCCSVFSLAGAKLNYVNLVRCCQCKYQPAMRFKFAATCLLNFSACGAGRRARKPSSSRCIFFRNYNPRCATAL
jgi:hypothetical protein